MTLSVDNCTRAGLENEERVTPFPPRANARVSGKRRFSSAETGNRQMNKKDSSNSFIVTGVLVIHTSQI